MLIFMKPDEFVDRSENNWVERVWFGSRKQINNTWADSIIFAYFFQNYLMVYIIYRNIVYIY